MSQAFLHVLHMKDALGFKSLTNEELISQHIEVCLSFEFNSNDQIMSDFCTCYAKCAKF